MKLSEVGLFRRTSIHTCTHGAATYAETYKKHMHRHTLTVTASGKVPLIHASKTVEPTGRHEPQEPAACRT